MSNLTLHPHRRAKDEPRSGGPEHISSVLERVLDELFAKIEANRQPLPEPPPQSPPAQRSAA
jgi:hypothetical protein